MREELITAENTIVAIGTLDRLGDLIRRAAIPVAVFVATDSALAVGLAAATSFVPYLLMMRFSASLGDPSRARRTLIVLNLVRAVVSLGMAVLAVLSEFGILFYLHIFVLAALTAVVETAFGATIRVVTAPHDLQRLNARLGAWQNGLAALIGLPLGGLLGATSPAIVFALDGATYALVVVMVSFGPISSHNCRTEASGSSGIGQAFNWLRSSRLHYSIVGGVMMMNFASGMVFGNLIVVAVRQYDFPERWFGLVPLLWSVAVTAGSLVIGRRAIDTGVMLIGAPTVQVSGYLILAATGSLPLLVVAMARGLRMEC